MKKMNLLEFIEKTGSFKVMFKNNLNFISEQVNEQVSEQVLNNVERYKIIKTLLIEGKLDYTIMQVIKNIL